MSPAIERFVGRAGPAWLPTAATQPGPCRVDDAARRSVALMPAAAPPAVDHVTRPSSRQVPPPLPPPTPPHRSGRTGSRLLTMWSVTADDGSEPEDRAAASQPTLGFPINLATALRLSDARPLIVAAAQASVWVAEAQLTRAKVLWVPSLIIGVDYIRHDGGGPDFNKGIMTAAERELLLCRPGLWQYVNLTDAIFEPLAARQVLNARHWDIQAAKNDALLQTADAYFQVHQYRGMYAGSLYSVERGHDLVERIAQPEHGPGPRGRGRPGPEHGRRPRAAGRLGAAGVAGRRVPTSPRCSGSTPARWSSRWSTTTSRSP